MLAHAERGRGTSTYRRPNLTDEWMEPIDDLNEPKTRHEQP
jgi:hypothetical protein